MAMVEFWLAIKVFGEKPPSPRAKSLLKIHRVLGYAFLAYLLLLMIVGFHLVNFMAEAGGSLDGRGIIHILLGMVVFVVLVLKILFIRAYRQYRRSACSLRGARL
jgi:phosphoglycerol transferase MdoB-like AlkP superfamily enzyme